MTFFFLTVLSCPSLCYGIKQEDCRKFWPSTHRAALPRPAPPCPAGTSKASNGSNSFISFFHKEYSRLHHQGWNLSLSVWTRLHHTHPKTKTNKPQCKSALPVSAFIFPSSPELPLWKKKNLRLFSLHPFSTHTSMVTVATM